MENNKLVMSEETTVAIPANKEKTQKKSKKKDNNTKAKTSRIDNTCLHLPAFSPDAKLLFAWGIYKIFDSKNGISGKFFFTKHQLTIAAAKYQS